MEKNIENNSSEPSLSGSTELMKEGIKESGVGNQLEKNLQIVNDFEQFVLQEEHRYRKKRSEAGANEKKYLDALMYNELSEDIFKEIVIKNVNFDVDEKAGEVMLFQLYKEYEEILRIYSEESSFNKINEKLHKSYSNREIGRMGVEEIEEFMHGISEYEWLKNLGFRWNEIGSMDIEEIEMFTRLLSDGLKHLDFQSNIIGNMGIKHLGALSEGLPRGLKSADFSSNDMGRLGVDEIHAFIQGLPNGLKVLYLGSNEIGVMNAEKITSLIEGLPAGLKYLDLGGNDLIGIELFIAESLCKERGIILYV